MKPISRPLTAALAITGAAVLVPSLALASTSHSAAARPTGAIAPACVNAHPVSGEAVIYLPGQQRAQDSQLAAQGCAGLPGGGVLSPGTIKAGTGIPLYSA
jgi:hypothetical protein